MAECNTCQPASRGSRCGNPKCGKCKPKPPHCKPKPPCPPKPPGHCPPGCRPHPCPPCPPTTRSARVRFLNNVAADVTVTFSIDGIPVQLNLDYKDTSAYQPVTVGTHTFKAQVDLAGGASFSTTVTFTAGQDYTLIAEGSFTALLPPKPLMLAAYLDDNSASTQGFSRLRLIAAAAGVGPLDVYVNDNFINPGEPLTYPNATPYLDLVPGVYSFAFYPTGTVVGPGTIPLILYVTELNPNIVTTLAISGITGNSTFPPGIVAMFAETQF